MSSTPAVVAHADWGVDPKKRWFATTTLDAEGVYRVHVIASRISPDSPDDVSYLVLKTDGESAWAPPNELRLD